MLETVLLTLGMAVIAAASAGFASWLAVAYGVRRVEEKVDQQKVTIDTIAEDVNGKVADLVAMKVKGEFDKAVLLGIERERQRGEELTKAIAVAKSAVVAVVEKKTEDIEKKTDAIIKNGLTTKPAPTVNMEVKEMHVDELNVPDKTKK